MPSFSETAWARVDTLRAAIDALPFNQQLAAGTLSQERFRFYIVQDALYLVQYARTLALAAAKAQTGDPFRTFAASALGAVAVEQALHETYLLRFGVDPATLGRMDPSPACLGYTSYLLATAYHDPWEVLVAALLPCFWLYWAVGTAITQTAAANNPYRAWIDTYADESFGTAVRAVIAIVDEAAAATTAAIQERMMTSFIRSCQWEWLFWDSAWHQRGWPVEV
jgi:thiaminase/transcriptional activator TenA